MLELERLNVFRGPAQVLRNLSLTVADRESVCLVGRNGAGKTTTIDGIMGLLPVRSGRVALGGRDITKLPTHRRALAGIGYSPEDAGIFPDLTVAENFRISQSLARSAGKGGAVVAGNGIDERVLNLFPEIGDFTGRRGLFLSRQKNMVAIGRARPSRRPSCSDEPSRAGPGGGSGHDAVSGSRPGDLALIASPSHDRFPGADGCSYRPR